ncbi:MAG: helix-turn-helix domain-containing protein [Bacilli bacterium]|nr:helix-turn-helix domain-containing protein [Bacilli bacterium]
MTIKEMREKTGLSQAKFGKLLDIPTINISRWEQGISKPPKYVETLIEKVLRNIGLL